MYIIHFSSECICNLCWSMINKPDIDTKGA